ncbi:MAG: hypothetical protein CMJ76_10405 [Planctomycetaceae bacterium]|nr:hypothetical protein [Planctomycetaceae bacterium]|tara:strand:+ start:227 stop:742 length:516 start_codon:yes stop_codon:yes gene_type:complete
MPFSDFPELSFHPALNTDQDQIVKLIDKCYQEYGDRVILQGDDSDLLDIERNYRKLNGEFIVVRNENKTIIGTHAVVPVDQESGLCTFRRLYLDTELRGTGLGKSLMMWAIDWARKAGFRRVEFWSDTRFTRAHTFFSKLGFQTTGEKRDMDDGIQPYSEFFFWLDITPNN